MKRKKSASKKPGKKKVADPIEMIAYGNTWRNVAIGTPEDVRAAEVALGVTFATELAELLMNCGAGSPKNNHYENWDNDIEIDLGYILPLVDRPKVEGVVSECELYRKIHALPLTLIPFALDTGHANFICYRIPTNDIVYWLHDDPDNRVRDLAPSLEEFLSGLEECPF